jgi:hypothetical protein
MVVHAERWFLLLQRLLCSTSTTEEMPLLQCLLACACQHVYVPKLHETVLAHISRLMASFGRKGGTALLSSAGGLVLYMCLTERCTP